MKTGLSSRSWISGKKLAILSLLASVYPVNAQAQATTPAQTRPSCEELRFTDFSGTDDAITQISSAQLVAAKGNTPEYCVAEGYVWRNTRFRIRFPTGNWNGKMVVIGPGGQGGSLTADDPAKPGLAADILRRGYATVQHDSGHFSTVSDVKWAWNNDSAMIDFGFRSVHSATVAAKAVLERLFGKKPEKSFYSSCSNGGREAMMAVQRYPWDFDGVVAGAPSMASRDLIINMLWIAELVRDQSPAGFNPTAASVLHKGVIAQCDKIDGKLDGILADPRQCKVDLAPLICKEGATANCLTPRQADIARKVYEGARTPEGEQIAPSTAFPGSEEAWLPFVTPKWVINYAKEMFQYLVLSPAPGPQWEPDMTKLGEYAKRMGFMESVISATNPDLRAFKARGGKLIAYYGWNDAFGGGPAVMDYYQTVERVMGGKDKTQDFFRLFMVPGMNHCGGGDGASVFDFLGEVDKWSATGKAPASITGFHPKADGTPEFYNTVRPYDTPK